MEMLSMNQVANYIQDVPDFPNAGVLFKDITPVLLNQPAWTSLIHHFKESMEGHSIDKIVAIESRGFLLGAALSQHLHVGLVLARKPGKLPREVIEYSYDLEYGKDTLQIHSDAIDKDERVMIVDDVLATGGTASAVEKIIEKTGAHLLGSRFLMEIAVLKGGEKLSSPYESLLQV